MKMSHTPENGSIFQCFPHNLNQLDIMGYHGIFSISRGKGVLDLLMILTCDPELPEYMGDKHNLGAKSNENQKTTETEVNLQVPIPSMAY